MITYVTADEHYGHDMILEYCKRPFKDTQRATREMIKRHNNVVKEDDTVIHVGDFAMAGPDRITFVQGILNRLNGTHILVLGNHDQVHPLKLVDIGFQSVHTSYIVDYGGYKWVFAHDPSIWNVVANWTPLPIFVHGHVHLYGERSVPKKRIVNAGVDRWGFAPISLDQILEELCL